MKVSIVIPLYNTEKYIARCIDSCLQQTYQDIEVIIINDGSTDSSPEIAGEYADRYDFIKMITTENRGLSAARNCGMTNSTGKYIYFLDSDDWIDADCIDKCVYYAERNNTEIITFDTKTFVEEGTEARFKLQSYSRENVEFAWELKTGKEFISEGGYRGILVSAWLVFVRKDFLLENGIEFPEGAYYEDVKFHFDCMITAKRIMYIPYQFYNRTYRQGSIINSKINMPKIMSIFSIGNGLLDSVENRAEDDKAFWLRYSKIRISELIPLVLRQVNCENIHEIHAEWGVIEAEFVSLIRYYYKLAESLLYSFEAVQTSMDLIYEFVRKLDFCSEEILLIVHDLEVHAEQFMCKRLQKLPLSDPDMRIGIYGSGKHADCILRYYTEYIGTITDNIVYIDSNKKSYVEKKDGKDIINVMDVEQCDPDCIVILSYLHENDMVKRANACMQIKIPIVTLYEEDKIPLDSLMNRFHDLAKKITAFPREIKNEKRIVLLNIAHHTNVGDYLITLAEEKFFERYFEDYQLLEFSGVDYAGCRSEIRKQIRLADIIVVTGGGFLGSLWFSGTNVNKILEDFPSNRIIIFPQSIYFRHENEDEELADAFYRQMLRCNDVKLCVRESVSLERAKKILGDDVRTYLIPDIALSLRIEPSGEKRNGVLLCLRRDVESVLTDQDKFAIWEKAKEISNNVSLTSMHWPEIIDNADKEKVIEKKFREFQDAELVITDTLHCMISCILTGTPCIAIDNLTGKIKGTYQWVHDLVYIQYFHNASEFVKWNLKQWEAIGKEWVYTSVFAPYEEQLKNLILNRDTQ